MTFPAQINLASINGRNGFIINAIDKGDALGRALSNAGDVNGDRKNDRLTGSSKNDTILGVAGNDTFVLAADSGTDTITEFSR